MKQDGKKSAKFIHGNRVVTVIEVPDDEIDAVMAALYEQMQQINEQTEARKKAARGFDNDFRD
jgi:hypothetical protein